MTSLSGISPVLPMDGWKMTPVTEVAVGWWVQIHGARYEVTKLDLRVVPGGNGMITVWGGPWGPDYIWDGGQVWMYTG